MKVFTWVSILIGLLLVSLSVWQIQSSSSGIEITRIYSSQLPVTAFRPDRNNHLERPTVLIGHGFAGSGTVMRGFALTLAHAGFNVLTWDFDGHGANSRSLGSSTQRDSLIENAELALREAVSQGLVSSERVAILGHSMGSGVALAYGQRHAVTAATIAVSPVLREVTPELPRNLLLMAGSQEPNFLENARQLLLQAGGESHNPAQGKARRLITIPGANHLTILFSTPAHQSVLEWVNDVFGVQPGANIYTDRRIVWFFLGVAGTLLAAFGLASLAQHSLTIVSQRRPVWHSLAAMTAGVLVATMALWLVERSGLNITGIFGMMVGGYLMAWFAIAGVTGLLVLGGFPPGFPLRSTLLGTLTFAILWLGVGLTGHMVWQPWLLIWPRLVLWPLASVFLLPWFVVVSELVRGSSWLWQIGAWLAHSALLLSGLFLAMQLTPGIGFLILIVPVFPVFFALHALASAPYRGGWAFALGGALFTAWMLLAVFPLA